MVAGRDKENRDKCEMQSVAIMSRYGVNVLYSSLSLLMGLLED